MKKILTERIHKLPLGTNTARRRYLEKVAAALNNELTDPSLTPVDRARFYNALIVAVKHIHDFDKDSKLEDIERRISILEKEHIKNDHR